jgi:mono/diheme cytochrome c family protein
MRIVTIIFFLLVLVLAIFLYSTRKAASPARNPPSVRVVSSHLSLDASNGFYVGKGDQRVYVNYATPDPLLRSFLQSVMNASADPSAQGKEIFLRICAVCHQRDGEGKDGVAPPLIGSEWALTPSGNRLLRIVLNGLNGPIRVRGRDWNLSMPPWRENLSDDQLSVVLTYIRTQLGDNHAGPITPETVAAARKSARSTPETADELLRISAP